MTTEPAMGLVDEHGTHADERSGTPLSLSGMVPSGESGTAAGLPCEQMPPDHADSVRVIHTPKQPNPGEARDE
jgi:hypothetical protein